MSHRYYSPLRPLSLGTFPKPQGNEILHIENFEELGIAVIDASQIKAYMRYEEKRQERAASDYAKLHKCKHCYEYRLCSLMGYKNCCTASACTAAYKRAYEYALSRIRERQET